jgi:hypothetical protein
MNEKKLELLRENGWMRHKGKIGGEEETFTDQNRQKIGIRWEVEVGENFGSRNDGAVLGGILAGH